MKIIGVAKREGVFNDKPYLNYRVYMQVDNQDNSWGIVVKDLKISSKNMDNILYNHELLAVSELVGLDVDPGDILYDQYGNVKLF